MGLNQVQLIGFVGNDPEFNQTQGGAVARFSLATEKKWKGQDGQPKSETTWHNIVFFNRLAEVVSKYVAKGSKLFVQGEIKTTEWQDRQTGEKRRGTQIICNQLIMLGDKGNQQQDNKNGHYNKNQVNQNPSPSSALDDPDIPF